MIINKFNAQNVPGKVNVFIGIICFLFLVLPLLAQAAPESPEQYFTFKPGADGMLIDYESLIHYLEKLDNDSPRVKLEKIGFSPMGKPMFIAFISAEENINNLEHLRAINKSLALDDTLSESQREQFIQDGRVFVLGALSMHADEVGPSQAAASIAYDLATTQDPQKLKWLSDVVYMMVPCHNPDGMDMVVEHYHKYKGGKYEGCSFPGLYHKYIGHDINRDFVTLSQQDNKNISAIWDKNWFPQVMVEKHQMGSVGPRYFVPPFADPIAENIDADIWNWSGLFGANMAKDMTAQGLSGISQHYFFDDYWPGSTETAIFKNVIGLLTEAASTKHATPIFVEPNELSVWGKGLSEYKKSINMPLPWPGGWWRLGDIVQYEIASTLSIIKTSSLHRAELLRFRHDLCRKEVNNGKTQPPFYYILPLQQHDTSELVNLVKLLQEHGITLYQLRHDSIVAGKNYLKGDIVIPLAQPFRPFIKEVMEKQYYPIRHYTPNGEMIEPYDVTSWSLPLHMGITAIEITNQTECPIDFDAQLEKCSSPFSLPVPIPDSFFAALLSGNHNESYKAAFIALKEGYTVKRLQKPITLKQSYFPIGSFVIFSHEKLTNPFKKSLSELPIQPVFIDTSLDLQTTTLKMPRIALVESYFEDMDAGWTRYLLDTYVIPFTVVRPGDFETTNFSKTFDVVIFPDSSKDILLDGKYKEDNIYYASDFPPSYAKGIGKKGFNNLLMFLNQGGIVLSWGASTQLFIGNLQLEEPKQPLEEFRLPISDISSSFSKKGLNCPGSLLKIKLLPDHPLTFGLPKEIGIFFQGKPVFRTNFPKLDMDRRVIGAFPEQGILLSGYCNKEELLANVSTEVWLKKNKGQLVLFAFSPQFRAITPSTYKLLFNAILLDKLQ